MREPVGWRSLGREALAARVWTLWSAGRRPHDGQQIEATVARDAPPDDLGPRVGSAPVPPTNPEPLRPMARLAWALPWIVLAVGLGISVPVLIWAPLLGGVCMGVVLLQVGVIRQWARVRARRLMGPDGDPEGPPAVQSTGAGRLAKPGTSEGWLLAGFLSLAALLSGILLFTLDLQNRQAIGAAEALRVQRQSQVPSPQPSPLPSQAQLPPPAVPAEQLPPAKP